MSVEAVLRIELDQDLVHQAIRQILHYLSEHPLARDTARGVAEWWAGCSRATAEAALRFLLSRGIVLEISRRGQLLYARNPGALQTDLKALFETL